MGKTPKPQDMIKVINAGNKTGTGIEVPPGGILGILLLRVLKMPFPPKTRNLNPPLPDHLVYPTPYKPNPKEPKTPPSITDKLAQKEASEKAPSKLEEILETLSKPQSDKVEMSKKMKAIIYSNENYIIPPTTELPPTSLGVQAMANIASTTENTSLNEATKVNSSPVINSFLTPPCTYRG